MLVANGASAESVVKPFHLDEATISDVQAAYRSGALTAARLVQAYQERIQAYDQAGPKLNVVIFLNPKAREEAAALDEHLRKTGTFVGPLHGIPVLLKDNVNTKDMPTTGGSLSLAGYMPATDAAITQKLRSAGAIILAKVNLHEFAIWGETVSSIRGQTLNPYDLTRTPGGSSGGTGAGPAANFAVAGIGTDTVNSIRSPASANSIVGIRPTLGLVSRAGVIPYSFTQDAAGPLARTVSDATKMLNVLVGYDPNDPVTAWSVGNIEKDYTKFLKADGVKGKRIGVLRSFFGNAPINDEVNIIANQAVEDLRRLGATVIELLTPDL
jgi:Asp-tRNA(Asn)/Glu-tRNA(Gln) amidotransferase A subunit family amidase